MALEDVAQLPLSLLCLAAAVTGILSHLGYFIRGEHHLEAPALLACLFLLPTSMFVSYSVLTDFSKLDSIIRTTAITITYLASITASIISYRLFFHPLRNFPGPTGARVSKLWHVGKIISAKDNFKFLDGLHNQYGDFVRTGPSEISIRAPEAVPLILGPKSTCTKAPWYDGGLPLISMHTCRDKVAHDKRRRIWDHGFNAAALRNYESRILGFSETLIEQIRANAGKAISAKNWFHFFAFDVMGDIAFGKSFGMLDEGKEHFALELLMEGMEPVGVFGPVPWAFQIMTKIPGAGAGYKKFVSYCAEQSEKRREINKQMDSPDVMSWLVDEYENSPSKGDARQWLYGDARLLIVAGSDTTAATLTYAFYHLAQDPNIVKSLREELTPILKEQTEFNMKGLQNAPFLNAVINETLRLHPPVPSGVLRLTPPEGIQVGNTFIPGNTTVLSPHWTVSRLERCYTKANDFIPERWTTRPELIKYKDAYAPFSLGPFSCVGKQLALIELRAVMAQLVSGFDVRLAPGEDGSNLLEKSMDFFTISLADLKVVFTPIQA